jgi:predicted molibdopterin-dependent oxidoreductase YjgC
LAQAQRPVILYGPSWLRGSTADARPLDATANLALLLGGIEAAFVAQANNTLGALEMGVVPDLWPGRQPLQDAKIRSRLQGLWGAKLSPVAGLGFDGMMAAAGAGTLQALWVMGADPGGAASEALRRIPFLVVQDLFLTETASAAAVVLPAASFAEADGTFTNLTGRHQAIRAAKRPPGQARPDWSIIADLAGRMAAARGKQRNAWDFAGPAGVLDEISKAVPGYQGVDLATIGLHGWQPVDQPAATQRAFVRVEPGSIRE